MSDSMSRWGHDNGLASFVDAVLEHQGDRGDAVVPTGLAALDERLCGGLQTGSVSLVAGVPGVGTSTFCLGIARHTVFDRGSRAVVLVPDSPGREIFTRIVSAEARVPIDHLRAPGGLSETDIAKIRRREGALRAAPLVVDAERHDAAHVGAMVGTVGEWIAEGARLVVLDGTYQAEPVTRELIAGLKAAARDSNAAVLVASKILMPGERRGDRPELEDLREYEAVADLCDLVLALHRPDMFDHESLRAAEADIEVLKNRYGGTLPVTVLFQGHYARFVDMAMS